MPVVHLSGYNADRQALFACPPQYFINIVIKGTSHAAKIKINRDTFNYLFIFARHFNEINIMKKSIGCSLLLSAILLAACDKKENSYDFAQILYPNNGYTVLYADQVTDSLKFATTYDWTLSVSADWMSIVADSMSGTVPAGAYMVSNLTVHFEANNTDTVRSGYVGFHADGKMLQAVYAQVGFLDVRRPNFSAEQSMLTDSARQAGDSITFRTYSNDWTLAFKDAAPDWIRLADGAATSGKAGLHTVAYLLDENTSAAERSAILQLKSRGVTADIHIRQEGAKQDAQE